MYGNRSYTSGIVMVFISPRAFEHANKSSGVKGILMGGLLKGPCFCPTTFFFWVVRQEHRDGALGVQEGIPGSPRSNSLRSLEVSPICVWLKIQELEQTAGFSLWFQKKQGAILRIPLHRGSWGIQWKTRPLHWDISEVFRGLKTRALNEWGLGPVVPFLTHFFFGWEGFPLLK